MNGRHFRILGVLALFLSFRAADALACSCSGTTDPCEALGPGSVVIAGIVRSVGAVDRWELGAPYPSTLVKLEVERSFVNGSLGIVELTTGRGGGDCGYRFVAGRRYLVYASKATSGQLVTSICSRTRPLEAAAEDLAYLSTLPQQPPGVRVYGRVTQSRRDPFEAAWINYGPVENVLINLRGASFSRDVSTDKNGRYEFPGVASGAATLTLIAPTGFDTRYLEREIEIPEDRACSAHNFGLRQIASASGTVIDSSGRPVAGILVDAVAAELAGHLPPPYQEPKKTDDRGRFEFDDLPPGLYVFGINLTKPEPPPPGYKPAGPAVFLPGTAVASEAAIVEMKPNDRVDVGILRLPGR